MSKLPYKYTYSVTENVPHGYVVDKPVGTTGDGVGNGEAVKNETETLTITNKPIKYTAEFVKFDQTYYNSHHSESGYHDILLSGAKFELHKVYNDTDTVVELMKNDDGTYSPKTSTAVAAEIVTGADGKISFKELPPNEYYLVETEAPAGYEIVRENNEPKHYVFKADVDQSVTVEYTSGSRIGNDEMKRGLKLTKTDAADSNPLADAKYLLLKLIPMEVNNNAGIVKTNANAYLEAAQNAIDSTYADGDEMWNYWVKTREEVYTTDSSGVLTASNLDFGTYIFYETEAPYGYGREFKKDALTLDHSSGDNYVGTFERTDPRITGKFELTKTGEISTVLLPGAKFKLERVKADNTTEIIKVRAVEGGYETDAAGTAELTTDSNGKLHIEGLDWGSYVLTETAAPSGYKLADFPVRFRIGRNNCTEALTRTMKNFPKRAQIMLQKEIDKKNIAAWGAPTFIFRITNTQTKREHKVSITLDGDDNKLTGQTGWINVEPGTYEVTEISVARYAFKSGSFGTLTGVSNNSFTGKKATLTIAADGQAVIKFVNELAYMDKQSHSAAEVNRFGGYKGIAVLCESEIAPVDGAQTVSKSDLRLYRITSGGVREEVTESTEKAKITAALKGSANVLTVTDNGETITLSGAKTFKSGKVFTLTAEYDGFETEFEIRFTHDLKVS